jgi:hypothetical protein
MPRANRGRRTTARPRNNSAGENRQATGGQSTDVTSTEIPKQDWGRFLDDFSRRHQGWLVKIEGELTDRGEASPQDLPLEAVTRQLDGQQDALAVVMRQEGRPQAHLIHSVGAPSALQVEEHDSGAEKRLLVRSAKGRTTVVRLHRAILPPVREDVKRES